MGTTQYCIPEDDNFQFKKCLWIFMMSDIFTAPAPGEKEQWRRLMWNSFMCRWTRHILLVFIMQYFHGFYHTFIWLKLPTFPVAYGRIILTQVAVPGDQLATHQCFSVSGSSGWKCPCCDIVSPTASAAQKHMDSHSGVKAFRCTICRYKGNTLRGMRTHIRMHFEKRSTDLQVSIWVQYKSEVFTMVSVKIVIIRTEMKGRGNIFLWKTTHEAMRCHNLHKTTI